MGDGKMFAIVLIDLLRRFWLPGLFGLTTLFFSGLRQAPTADVRLDEIILMALTIITGAVALRKNTSQETINSLRETIDALREENKERERQLAEKQTAHSESLEDRITQSQSTILNALQATARENRLRIGQVERRVGELCNGLEEVAKLATSAHEIALQAVAYRNNAIGDLLDLVEGLDYPPDKQPLINELRGMLRDSQS